METVSETVSTSGANGGDAYQPYPSVLMPKDPIDIPLYYNGVAIRTLRVWTSRKLGEGGFGVVLEGAVLASETANSELVAVKRFNAPAYQNLFQLREFKRWNALRHPHILPFLGACNLGAGQFGLVSPLCRKGNMKQFLEHFPETNRLALVKQVADALYYLHIDAGVIHGDLKCANVLISNDDSALLCDFGLSTLVERSETRTATQIRNCLTAAFAAPELFEDNAYDDSASTVPRSKTVHSDSFAFARLIYEAFAGEAAWSGQPFRKVWNHAVDGDIPERKEANSVHSPFNDVLWQLCLDCWKMNPFARPNAPAIRDTLRAIA